MRRIQPIAETIVLAHPSAQVHVLAPNVVGREPQAHAAHRLGGRPLRHIVDDAARRAEAVHEPRRALEQFDLLEVLVGRRRGVAQKRLAVDAKGILPVQLQPAHGQVAGPGAMGPAVVRHRSVRREQVSQLHDGPVVQVAARDHGGRERRLELRQVAQRAGIDRRLQVMERGGFAGRGDRDGGKLLGGFRCLVLVLGGCIGGGRLGREGQGQCEDEDGVAGAYGAGAIGEAILVEGGMQRGSRVGKMSYDLRKS